MTTGRNGGERVVWPRGPKTIGVRPMAPRLETLAGKTIAQLWDDVFRGDEVFALLEQALGGAFPGVRFVNYQVFGSTHGERERQVLAELPTRLRQHRVDAVISGMAC